MFAVVVPAFCHARYVEETVASALAQEGVAEIVVRDDASSDDTADRAERALGGRGRVLRGPNLGAPGCLNAAIAVTSSPWAAVLNSDDVWLPGHLGRAARWLEAGADAVAGDVELIDADGAPLVDGPAAAWLDAARADRGPLLPALLRRNCVVTTSNLAFRRSAWAAVGGFSGLPTCHDVDFVLAVASRGAFVFDRGVTHVRYRVHPDNTVSRDPAAVRRERERIAAWWVGQGLLEPSAVDDLDAEAVGRLVREVPGRDRHDFLTRY